MSALRSRWLATGAAPAWALIGGAACAAMIPLEPSFLEEGMIVHIAQRMVGGEHLYRDIASFTGPFPFELLAALFRLFGQEIAVGRWAVVALHAATCAAVYTLACRARAGPLAHAAAACMASAPVLLFPLYSIYFYSTLAAQLSLIAACAALRATRSPAWAVAAGVLTACAALSKQTVGALLAPALLAALAAAAPPGERLRRALAMTGGALLVAAITLGGFGARGDLDALVRSLIVLPLSLGETFDLPYLNLWPLGQLAPAVRENQAFYLPHLHNLFRQASAEPGSALVVATQLLYALPFAALAATAIRRSLGPLPPAVWLHTAALLALTVNLFPRPDWGHLVFALPSSAIQLLLIAPGSERRAGGLRAASWAAALLVLALGAGSFAAGAKLHRLAGPPSFGPRVPQLPVSRTCRGPAAPRVIRYLRQRLLPGEAIFVARAEPLVYFATDARSPTPFAGVLPAIRDEQQSRILGALADIRYVVMSDIDQPVFTYYRDQLPAVQAHLERHFHVPDEFTGANSGWILVLERGADRGATAVDLVEAAPDARAWIRDRSGGERPSPASPPRLATRHNRRPLPFWLGARGGGIDFQVDIPRSAVFQADVGLRRVKGLRRSYRHPGPSRLAVSIGEGGRFEPLASMRVPGLRGSVQRWTPLEASLAAYAGRRVTLRLELVPEAPLPPGSLAWWGSPRIAVRSREAPTGSLDSGADGVARWAPEQRPRAGDRQQRAGLGAAPGKSDGWVSPHYDSGF